MNSCPMECWIDGIGRDTLKIKHYWFKSRGSSQVICTMCGTRGPIEANDRAAVRQWNKITSKTKEG